VSTDADIATIREALALAHPVTAEDHSLVEEAEAALERVAEMVEYLRQYEDRRERLRADSAYVGFFARLTADALTRMAADERWEAALTQHGVPLNELRAALERVGK
jgi:hypothetical protein